MIWVLVIIVVAIIYNAERLPQIAEHIKGEAPHFVEEAKKMSKELKEKAASKHSSNKDETSKKG